MKKKKIGKYILFLLSAVAFISLLLPIVAGSDYFDTSREDVELFPPSIEKDGEMLYITPGEGDTPTGYAIYVDEVHYKSINNDTFDLSSLQLADGIYTIQVVAVYKDSKSELSNWVTYYRGSTGVDTIHMKVGETFDYSFLYPEIPSDVSIINQYVVWEFHDNEGMIEVADETTDIITFKATAPGVVRYWYMGHILTDGGSGYYFEPYQIDIIIE